MTIAPAGIYSGTLDHRRLVPTRHQFSYPLFMVMLDVDRIPEMMNVSRLTSYNRFNWASFHDRDHLPGASVPLRRRIEEDAAVNGIDLPSGPIYLLTHLRYLGYVFNPVSFFYCYDSNGTLSTVLAEVNNTFGESRNYWLNDSSAVPGAGPGRYRAGKSLHVSPFMPMEMEYEFHLPEPGDRLTVAMSTFETGSGMRTFDAVLSLERWDWSAATIRRALARHPWMSLKVIAAIHWQALILLVKKVPVFPNPTRRGWRVW